MARKKYVIGKPVGPDKVEVFHPNRRFRSGAIVTTVSISTFSPKGAGGTDRPLHRPKRRRPSNGD